MLSYDEDEDEDAALVLASGVDAFDLTKKAQKYTEFYL